MERAEPSGTVRGPMVELDQVLPESAAVNADGHLQIGGCDLVELAERHGTPLVVYDEGQLRAAAAEYRDGFAADGSPAEVIYASKAYWGLAMLRLAREEGLSIDVASGGELYAAIRAGFPPDRIYMHGNNKVDREIEELLDAGVGTVILDNFDELAALGVAASARGVRQRVMVRVTPGVTPSTHSHISTGQVDSKFGFPLAEGQAGAAVEAVRAAPGLELVGLHAHVGSQLLDLAVYGATADALADLAERLGSTDITAVNMGGGLGIAYTRDERPPSIAEYARAVSGAVRDAWSARGMPVPRLLVEPGRSIVGRAGVTVYRVGGRKVIPGVRTYISVDGGMSDHLRPMLYGSVYEPLVANHADGDPAETVRIVGKHCESGDILVREAHLPLVKAGDLIALPASGAYGVCMASNYNGAPRPAVVFVDRGADRVVTRRESYADMLARDA